MPLTHTSFISDFFEDFYYHVLKQKEYILSGKWQEKDATQVAEFILKGLQTLLEEQSLKSHAEGGTFGVACYQEAQYIMAALGDEIFLNLSWEGRAYWETHLLEQRLFTSHIAGERFFILLEDFLKERNPLKTELGRLYLTCLGLGFRGKYRKNDDQGILKMYRHQLFGFIYHQKALSFSSSHPLFPQPLLYTLDDLPSQHMPEIRQSIIISLFVLMGYVGLSYGIWYSATASLHKVTVSILRDAEKLK